MTAVRWLLLFTLLCSSAFAAKPKSVGGETDTYLCIGQGSDPSGKRAPSAEARVKIRLSQGKFDRAKEPTPATATFSGLQLHDGRGKTQKVGRAISMKGTFENRKVPPRPGHNFDAVAPRAELVREVHINMGNGTRNPSSLKIARGKRLVSYYMICQWE
jgi:hypothetical protein